MGQRWKLGGRLVAGVALALGLATASGSCSSEPERKGELMLVFQTDMEVPKDVDLVRVEIQSFGVEVFSEDYDVGNGKVLLPATLGVLAGNDPSAPVTIRLIGRQDGVLRTLREAVTTVPKGRVAMLSMPVQWLCVDDFAEERAGQVVTTCDEGQTCVAGQCAPATIDSAELPEFQPAEVFGGAAQGDLEGATCLDTVGCFAEGTAADLDLVACTAALPADAATVNFGIVQPPGSAGICGREACIVPLDAESDEGWREVGGRAKIAPGVCDRLSAGGAIDLAVTTACDAKLRRVPTCGPWSSVQAARATVDAAAPAAVNISPPDASAPAPDAGAPTTDGGSPPVSIDAGDGGAVVTFDALPSALSEGTSDDQVLTVTVPAGAVSAPTTLTIEPIANPPPELIGPAFEVGPTGTQFSQPVTMTFDYAGLDLAGIAPERLRVATLGQTGRWEELPSPRVDLPLAKVHGDTDHLSPFGLIVAAPDASVPCTPTGSEVCDGVDNDCDGTADNGFDLQIDPNNCGTCGSVCTFPNGTSTCSGGACVVETCNTAWGNCNTLPADGCETNLNTSAANCGACGSACTNPNGTTVCSAGSCVPTCAVGFANCDANAVNGCETSTASSVTNCGACAAACSLPNATPACLAGLCQIASCTAGFVDLDANPANGCELVCTPTGPELCDNADNDCNGLVDDNPTDAGGACGSAVGECASGVQTCVSGALMCTGAVAPVAEICDTLDNDCDGIADDGFNLQTDASNCGSCGTVCNAPNATSTCAAGTCAVGTCSAGWDDCNAVPADGCEANLTTTTDCGACGNACTNPNGATACTAGTCVPSCAVGYADCDANGANGCETSTASNVTDCGSCGNVCSMPNATPACAAGLCQIASCAAGFVDLDGVPANGCELVCTPTGPELCDNADNDCNGMVDDNPTDAGAPCGSATGECVSGATTCVSGTLVCTGGISPVPELCDGLDNDCNGTTDDGFNLVTDVNNCGACGNVCNLANATSACSGTCVIGACNAAWGDCDAVAANGCEAGLDTSTLNCGACGFACTNPNGTTACSTGLCVPTCSAGFANCDANPANGCETSTASSVNDCGSCGNVCNLPNATPLCSASACQIASCTAGFVDLDGLPGNGCELVCAPTGPELCNNLDDDCNGTVDDSPTDAGAACGSAVGECVSGATTCVSGSLVCTGGISPVPELCDALDNDCDGAVDNGFDTQNDASNCGACGNVCNLSNATSTCSIGACVIGTCNAAWGDCDATAANGCEMNLDISTLNCGTCGVACTNPNGTTTCSAGSCVPTCAGSFADCDANLANGCETSTSSVTDCGACGNVCNLTNATPQCSTGTCQIASCTPGFVDVDGLPGNGCELACTPTGPETCDNTDNDCNGLTDDNPTGAGAPCGSDVGECVSGTNTCVSGSFLCVGETVPTGELCDALDNDCDGAVDNGFDTQNDASNCGACGNVCNLTNATSTCSAGMCVIGTCSASWDDCNGLDSDGCEADLVASTTDCGTCGLTCTNPNGTTACTTGLCNPSCAAGFASCDANANNGCETSTDSSVSNCGGCGVVCNLTNATPLCSGGTCQIASCTAGFVDLDGLPGNGCELVCTPTGPELCDNADNDCNGMVDDNPTDAGAVCGSSVGECVNGTTTCLSGSLVCTGGISPTVEVCDNLDNDCNGLADDNPAGVGGPCGPNVGECVSGTNTCLSGSLVCVGGVGPSAEICDALDNDCNGLTDDNVAGAGGPCGSNVGECASGINTCVSGSFLCVGETTPTAELCDALDNDCDGTVDNGIDLQTDPSNCGLCGLVCSVPNGTSDCSAGNCVVGTCNGAFADCDGIPGTGCEINLDSDVNHCGSCPVACSTVNGTPSCALGACNIACNAAFGDCDFDVSTGCEANKTSDPTNCGACGNMCPTPANATPACIASSCTIGSCTPGWFNLDLSPANGCEYACVITGPELCDNTDNDCNGLVDDNPQGAGGPCGSNTGQCQFGTTACVSGILMCQGGIGPVGEICDALDNDCDGTVDNGIDFSNDPLNCGACGNVCNLANASSTCALGACAITACNAGHDDCDTLSSTGCETSLTTTTDCGTCGMVCPDLFNATEDCSTGVCVLAVCDAGWNNCDAIASNGCETNTTNNVNNCGTCNYVCPSAGGTPNCVSGVCGISTCNPGLGDCDGLSGNGCEIDLQSTLTSCGGCGVVCSLANATESCITGTCQITTCTAGWGNCDSIASTGCEVDTNTNVTNCGACGNTCTNIHGTTSCAGGNCSPVCNATWANCDGNNNNGCETSTNTVSNCGSCGAACSSVNGTPSCGAGTCSIACNAGWDACDVNPNNGCETNINTSLLHCGGCNVPCATTCVGGSCL